MTHIFHRTAAFADRIAASFAILAKLALVLIVIGITVDAMGRYVFSAPIQGMHAIVEGLLQPMVVFCAIALVARADGHMRVDVLPIKRSRLWSPIREAIFSLAISIFWLTCGWQAGSRALDAYRAGRWPVGEVAVPEVVSFSIVAISCVIAALCHLLPKTKK